MLGNHVYVESFMLGSSPRAWARSEHARAAHHVTSDFSPAVVGRAHLSCLVTALTCLCLCAGEAALRGEPRLQTLPVASALTAHRTGPPPISPSKRKFSVDPGDDDLDCDADHASKMSRIFVPHL